MKKPAAWNDFHLTPSLTPHGRLVLAYAEGTQEMEPALVARVVPAFAQGAGHGLLWLGAVEAGHAVPPALGFWRDFGERYVTALCTRPEAEARQGAMPPPSAEELEAMVAGAPVMPGAEYLTAEVLRSLWNEIGTAVNIQRAGSRATVQEFLESLNSAWNVVGRVHFNLAENRADEHTPFAFLATYTDRLAAHGKARHLPLGDALSEYAGAANRERLLSLLLPVQRAAEHCPWLKRMVASGEIYHPIRWTAREAFQFLTDIPELERAGIVIRMPAVWKTGRPARPRVSATVGEKPPSGLGEEALLDFRMEITLDGQRLTPAEVEALLAENSGLVLLRGEWVEVDHARLSRTLDRFQEAERLSREGGFTFVQAMRLLAGADVTHEETASADPEWTRVIAGPWLAETLQGLRSPKGLARVDPGRDFHGTLRPYQRIGLRWLHFLSELRLGACLADDMGLGKTIQVLALLLVQKRREGSHPPSLIVAPASLLANWAAETERFAPGLRFLIAHPSAMPGAELRAMTPESLAGLDLVITSYASLRRFQWLLTTSWDLAILDEAQAIKNPAAQQSKAAKLLQARARIALTGTPVENRLGDLWSILDFLNPGLLGSAREFTIYTRRLADRPHNPYGPLRDLVRPYILRRLKTDKSVIADLPDKTEVKAYCSLSRKQAALYQQAVKDLAQRLEGAEGIQRRGVVLAMLVRLKQICNHPSQWLRDGDWGEAQSGKWARLRELGEIIAAKQEKALVFTQFREITAPLAAFLGNVFGRPGLVMHGETEVRRRRELVARFQEDEAVPFFVLSLKVGGAGLNLTAASHVVHFDRWWNPAVEDQATDRAFRIGQTKNVLVHKFVCRGTVEEKIDALIESKKLLSKELLEGGAELNLTELRDEELMRLVALDLHTAIQE